MKAGRSFAPARHSSRIAATRLNGNWARWGAGIISSRSVSIRLSRSGSCCIPARGISSRRLPKCIWLKPRNFRSSTAWLLTDPDLAYLEEGTAQFKAYWNDLQWAQEYAFMNRDIMMRRVPRRDHENPPSQWPPTAAAHGGELPPQLC